MRVVFALLTVAAGTAAATSLLSPFATENDFAVVTSVGAGGVARVAVPKPGAAPAQDHTATRDGAAATEPAKPRFFGFALPFAPTERTAAATDPQSTLQQPTRQQPASQRWSTEVVTGPALAPNQVVSTTTAAASKITVAQVTPAVVPPRDKPRPEMVREIQQQLKRVGCYAGDANGEWGQSTRRAMQAFMIHVNSSLNSDDPGLIQLTLVRGFTGVACAAACQPERMAPGTRTCLQGPMMATRPTVAPQPTEAREVRRTSPASPPPEMVAGSSATGGAVVQSRGSVLPTGAVSAGALQTPLTQTPVAVQATVVPVMPLDGRMAIGGPAPPATEGLKGAPVSSVTTVPVARAPKPQRPQSTQSASRNNWTAGFFDR